MTLKYLDLTLRNYRKNRTIVSDDIESILTDIATETGLPITIERYASGSEIATWIVPPSWNVKEAWIKAPDNSIVADYREHPLFVVPYSLPFQGKISKQELEAHVRFHPLREEDFFYEHRFAYDFRQRLKDWAVTLPRTRFGALPDGDYQVNIDLDIRPGEMLVGKITLPGETRRKIALLTDYCHPGQVNDSWSGILTMIDVMKELAQRDRQRFTYELYFFPETIGSCVYLATNQGDIDDTDLAIFCEFVGWGKDWKILAGDRRNSLATKIAAVAASTDLDFSPDTLFAGYGNDEIIYDYAGVPAMSVQMNECDEYHSSSDHPDRLEQDNIDKAAQLILNICDIMESNRSYRLKYRVPVYLTRFDLYADSVNQEERFLQNRAIMNGINNGCTLMEISSTHDIDFHYIRQFVDKLIEYKLVEARD
jgi:aminopeptidase-like protein